ncbi:MAG: response regulator transcription factor [Gaiellaceae bacterium]
MIRVLVLGDVRLHREGLAALIARDGRVTVAATAPTADGAAGGAGSVDVIVVDTATYEAPEQLRELADIVHEPIVALGVPRDERRVIAFAEGGVLGFVEREASLDELVASIVSAARGEASCPPRIATTLLRRVTALAAREVSPDVATLTIRERQIVEIIAEGLSNKEIAARLSIEVATVKNHVHNILEKLQVSGRTEAVTRLRLVEGGESSGGAAQARI